MKIENREWFGTLRSSFRPIIKWQSEQSISMLRRDDGGTPGLQDKIATP